ncbi:MAG: hypothetical protein J5686_01435 [Bacteroidales bacterium]|nr:hypothetical protein [Bacteroidales bacterium]
MKKIFLTIAIVFMVSFGAKAQSDGFFRDGGIDNYSGRTESPTPIVPTGQVGTINDTNAPLGEGLLILTAMGAGYAIMRRKK